MSLRHKIIRLASTLPVGSEERKQLLSVLAATDEAQTGWSSLLDTQKMLDDEDSKQDDFRTMLSVLKTLRKGDKVEISYIDPQRGGSVSTIRPVETSWREVQAEYPEMSFVTVYTKGGAVRPGSIAGGVIRAGTPRANQISWQATMQQNVRVVVSLKKV